MNLKLKVIFIAGTGRCGSTLLDATLAQMPNTTSVGELRYLWKRGILENRLCGSGMPFLEHLKWNNIVGKLYGDRIREKAEQFEKIEQGYRIRHMLGVKSSSKLTKLKVNVSPYAKELANVFNTIRDEFKSDIIIDSSKKAMHGFALAQIPDIDLRIIHLVRDRKAVVHSWNTSKFDKGKNGMMNTQSVKKASIEWVFINKWIGRYLGDGSVPYLRLNYADFTENPKCTMNELLDFIGEDRSVNPILADNSFNVIPSPSISGNPMRFSDGNILIKEDVRWKRDMPYSKRILSDSYAMLAKSLFFL